MQMQDPDSKELRCLNSNHSVSDTMQQLDINTYACACYKIGIWHSGTCVYYGGFLYVSFSNLLFQLNGDMG